MIGNENGRNGRNGRRSGAPGKPVIARREKLFLALGVVAMIGAFVFYWSISKEGETIHIAFGGPMSGEGAAAGKLMTRAIQSYLDRVNNDGGVNGKQVVLDVFDDRNDHRRAGANAREMVGENRVLAVIGHWYSSCSISAGEVYGEFGIPALTPGAIREEVTRSNPWYFRTIYNIRIPGLLIPRYIKNVLKYDTASVIHEDGSYGRLADLFLEHAPDAGLVVENRWRFTAEDPELDLKLRGIVDDLKAREVAGVLFLVVQAPEGVKLVRKLREAGIENPIIGPSSFAEETFRNGFQDLSGEHGSPGCYTNGIYVVTPLIFDTANKEAQMVGQAYRDLYKEEPDWSVAFAYDSAKIIIEAMKGSGVRGRPETLEEDRKKIRDYLAGIDAPEKAVDGATGFTYFDDRGDARKVICVGVYRNNNIISALGQLRPVRYLAEIPNLDEALEKKRVLNIEDRLMYKTNVVYTGVEINKISELDPENRTCALDFYIWFRCQGVVDATNIRFLNAADPIQWSRPGEEGAAVDAGAGGPGDAKDAKKHGTAVFIKMQEGVEGIKSYLFRVKARFKSDFASNRWGARGRHTIGFEFRHRDLIQNNLLFVTDVLGMGLGGELSFGERMKRDAVLNPEHGWSVDRAYFFNDVIEKSTMGNLNSLDIKNKMMEFSRFNFRTRVKKNISGARRKIPREYAPSLAAVGLVMLALLLFVRTRPYLRRRPRVVWLFQTAFAILLLLAAEVAMLSAPPAIGPARWGGLVILVFDALWWTTPALLFIMGLDPFIWGPLQEQTRRPVPNVLRRFVIYIAAFITIYGIIVYVLGLNINKLIATSGVIAMVIGFIVKSNISDFFSGVMINTGDAIRIGDWVKIGDLGEGKVTDITWQVTGLDPGDGAHLSIPNSDVLGAGVHTYRGYCRLTFTVEIVPSVPRERVEKILLDATLSAEEVLNDPGPDIRFNGQGDESCVYTVVFSARAYDRKDECITAVWKRVRIHLRYAGIRFAGIPGSEGSEEANADENRGMSPLTVLRELLVFQPFPDEMKRTLGLQAMARRIPAGRVLMEEGAIGNSLFIIVEGVVSVRVRGGDGESAPVARQAVGDIIGEIAFLTDHARTATIVAITETRLLEITREDMAPFMEGASALTEQLGRIVVERKAEIESAMKVHSTRTNEPWSDVKRIVRNIRSVVGPGRR